MCFMMNNNVKSNEKSLHRHGDPLSKNEANAGLWSPRGLPHSRARRRRLGALDGLESRCPRVAEILRRTAKLWGIK
jgi:hypothetical protein